jgi:hypothetical protein
MRRKPEVGDVVVILAPPPETDLNELVGSLGEVTQVLYIHDADPIPFRVRHAPGNHWLDTLGWWYGPEHLAVIGDVWGGEEGADAAAGL